MYRASEAPNDRLWRVPGTLGGFQLWRDKSAGNAQHLGCTVPELDWEPLPSSTWTATDRLSNATRTAFAGGIRALVLLIKTVA